MAPNRKKIKKTHELFKAPREHPGGIHAGRKAIQPGKHRKFIGLKQLVVGR